jgi:hypothetical protein
MICLAFTDFTLHSLAILTVDGGATVTEFLITKDRVDVLGCFVEKLLSKGFFLLKKLVAGCVAKAILVVVFLGFGRSIFW